MSRSSVFGDLLLEVFLKPFDKSSRSGLPLNIIPEMGRSEVAPSSSESFLDVYRAILSSGKDELGIA